MTRLCVLTFAAILAYGQQPQAVSLDITLAGVILTQEKFEEFLDPDDPSRGFIHFREERRPTLLYPAFSGQGNHTGYTDTGVSARQHIATLAVSHGWPLIGFFISASSEFVPHLVVVRADFPDQIGSPDQRPDRMTTAFTDAMEGLYHAQKTIIDPDDPEFGQIDDIRSFFAVPYFWNYRADKLYSSRGSGLGDFNMIVSTSPPGNWWQSDFF
jgi:hypothetical protein